ncbi:ABC transporter permease [Priestia megaterium]|nr:ABC transporter permease [Priestia megaterium]
MKILFFLFSFTCKSLLKNWKSLILLLMAPALFLIGAGLIITQTMKDEERVSKFPVAIVDQDNTPQTKYVIGQLTESEQLSQVIKPIYTDEQDAKKRLDNNEIAAMVVLPEGFSRSIAKGTNTPLEVIGNENKPLQSQLFRYLMESAADYTSAAQSGINTIDHFLNEAGVSEEERRSEFRKNILSFGLHVLDRGSVFEERIETSLFQQDIKHYYTISFFTLLLMIWSYSGLLFVKGIHPQSVLDRLTTRGVSRMHVHAAQFFAVFVLLLPLAACLYLAGIIVLKVPLASSYTELALAIAISLFAFLSLFTLLQSIVQNEKIYQLVGSALMIVSAVISGHLVPTVYLPHWLEPLQVWSLNSLSLQMMFSAFDGYASKELSYYLIQLTISGIIGFTASVLFTNLFRKRRVT